MDSEELSGPLPAELPGLLRFAHTLTADPGQAEDLVQETLSRALERSASFRGNSSLATWLHRILHNLAVDSARRSREEPTEDISEAVEALWREDAYTVDSATVIARAEVRSDLREALSHLPVSYRTVVARIDLIQVEGDLGAVVGVYWRGGYEVEFAGADGTILAVVTLGPGKLRKRLAREILHVREVA